jgi:hypothetical protein
MSPASFGVVFNAVAASAWPRPVKVALNKRDTTRSIREVWD